MKLTAARVEVAWRLPHRALDHLSQRRGPAPLRCAAALPPAPPVVGRVPGGSQPLRLLFLGTWQSSAWGR